MSAPIYVVVASDDLNAKYRAEELARNPGRKPNPIVFEQNVEGATLELARSHAASVEAGGYGAARIGRIVFEGEPGFSDAPKRPSMVMEELQRLCVDWGAYWRASDAHGVQLTHDQALELLRRALGVEVDIKAVAGGAA